MKMPECRTRAQADGAVGGKRANFPERRGKITQPNANA